MQTTSTSSPKTSSSRAATSRTRSCWPPAWPSPSAARSPWSTCAARASTSCASKDIWCATRGEGYAAGADPRANEVCDSLDNDCDGEVDEFKPLCSLLHRSTHSTRPQEALR
ncbi:MAG: hypothetical protein CO108_30530 [Deltaproteobacteria bacterium CG_4_9_14_3_um_filter_63_12]|nr:MAG: hypothetical protein CO108_30530 [Deltaproteobacteria bacterium CG_4_9_14_3_um_filter_63_12]